MQLLNRKIIDITELVVVSGKGGTGKTSIVASFAALAADKVLADGDVDAADLHLVLKPRVRDRGDFSGGYSFRIIGELCTTCGKCLRLCRFGAVVQGERTTIAGGRLFSIDPVSCEGCGVCAYFCPQGAIVSEKSITGEWFVSDTDYGPMVHARLGVAEENSGKLVAHIRQKARETAVKGNLGLVVIDGPPGIGCPVIASVSGCRFALIVAEPTLSGLHDLKRIAGLTRHFKIPTLICINKYDLNRDMSRAIEKWAGGIGLKVLGRIPYDPSVTEAQIAGSSVIEYGDGMAARAISALWQHLWLEIHPAAMKEQTAGDTSFGSGIPENKDLHK